MCRQAQQQQPVYRLIMLCVPKLLRSPPPRPPNTLQTTVSGMEVYLQKHVTVLTLSSFPILTEFTLISPHFPSLHFQFLLVFVAQTQLFFCLTVQLWFNWTLLAIKFSQAWMCYSYRLVKTCTATFGNFTSWHALATAPAANQRWLFLLPSAVELNQRGDAPLSGCLLSEFFF